MNQQDMNQGNGNSGKTGKAVRTLLVAGGYMAAIVVVLYILGVASAWINERIEGVQEEAAEAVNMSNGEAEVEMEVTYSQEELDAAVNAALAEAEAAADDRVEQATRTREEEILGGIKASLLEGDTYLEALRPYYPNEIVLASNGSYYFVPINEELKQNTLVQENLEVLESGEYQYLQEGEVISHKGIDVSTYQGNIDWQKVAADGVEFAFIRGGLRGYGTGKLAEDTRFADNMKNATAAGVKAGIYVFSQAITEEEVIEEAELLLKLAAPYGTDVPLVIDVEKVTGGDGRMNHLTVEERTNLVLLFCQTIENAGYKPMVYHNTEAGILMLDIAALENYPKWFASYSETLYYPYEYGIWQYSNKGHVDGIKGDVDLNISFSRFWEE